jgi:hypothetical protein
VSLDEARMLYAAQHRGWVLVVRACGHTEAVPGQGRLRPNGSEVSDDICAEPNEPQAPRQLCPTCSLDFEAASIRAALARREQRLALEGG